MILCGLFCAGKSTLGKALAAQTNLPFYDTDRLMETDQGKTVSELWWELGEKAFRDLETELVLSLKSEPCIIATGGGTLLREENRKHLKQIGPTIYLKAPVFVLWERLQKRGMPAYLDPKNPLRQVEQLAEERFPIFEQYCEYTIETEGLSVKECVHGLVERPWL